MTPKKPKGPSMAKVAKVYKKTTKPSTNYNEGSIYWTDGAKPTHLGKTTRTNNYKPSPKQVTVGGTAKGKGVTKKRIGRG